MEGAAFPQLSPESLNHLKQCHYILWRRSVNTKEGAPHQHQVPGNAGGETWAVFFTRGCLVIVLRMTR